MIEEQLITYGPLGMWTATLLAERLWTNLNMKKSIEHNTEILIQLKEVMKNGRSK